MQEVISKRMNKGIATEYKQRERGKKKLHEGKTQGNIHGTKGHF